MGEVAVPLAVAHDVVGDIFGHAGQLGQFLCTRGIQVDESAHRVCLDDAEVRWFIARLKDEAGVGQQEATTGIQ
jgi:hypothetical protein